MKTVLILDMSKWVSGGFNETDPYRIGKGAVKMRNALGFSCCLGLFAPQIEPSITNFGNSSAASPAEVSHVLKKIIKDLSEIEEVNSENCYKNTDLSMKAIEINDNVKLTVDERIAALKELFGKSNYEIEVINYKN